mgnify:CR=1 FL=1
MGLSPPDQELDALTKDRASQYQKASCVLLSLCKTLSISFEA